MVLVPKGTAAGVSRSGVGGRSSLDGVVRMRSDYGVVIMRIQK